MNTSLFIVTSLLLLPACSQQAPTDPDRLRDFAADYTAAWCSQNPRNVAAHFADGGSLTVNNGEPNIGRRAITAVAQGFMTAFPDMVVTMDSLAINGPDITYHWTLTGTNTGPGGTGNPVHISGYEEWKISPNGLIAESKGYFDETEYRRQLSNDSLSRLVKELEESLLLPDVRKSERLTELLADDFIEFGGSGRVYTKKDLTAILQEESPTTQTTSDFEVRVLGPQVALVTYRNQRHSSPPVYSLRSSVWQMREGRWQMVFHQATTTGKE